MLDLSLIECFQPTNHPDQFSKLATPFNTFLAKNRALDHLFINGNSLGDETFTDIIMLLLKNGINLSSLFASSNELSELSLSYLEKLVLCSSKLSELALNENFLEGSDLEKFLQAIIKQNNLYHLELGGTLDDENISQIASFIEISEKIAYLNLSDDESLEGYISEANVMKLMCAAQNNSSLEIFKFPYAELAPQTISSIAGIYSKHPSLNNCHFALNPGKTNPHALIFYKTSAQFVLKEALSTGADKELLSSKLYYIINNIFDSDSAGMGKEVDKFKFNMSQTILNEFNMFMTSSYKSINSKEAYKKLISLQKTLLHVLENYDWLFSIGETDTEIFIYSLYTRGENMRIAYNIQKFFFKYEEAIEYFIPFLEDNLKPEVHNLNYYAHIMQDFIRRNIYKFQLPKLGRLVGEVQNLLTGEAAQSWKYIFDKVTIEQEVTWAQTVKRHKLNDGNFSPCNSL
jgi:hypothetical protein